MFFWYHFIIGVIGIMDKKGFTLVEILVTIGLLAILGAGIGVSLNKVLKNKEENTYETFIEKN